MNLSKYECLNCGQGAWETYSTLWMCRQCQQVYSCVSGIPRLYVEGSVGERDRELRDYFYNGLLGTYYQHVMPFLSLPVRPARANWKGWLTYAAVVVALLALAGYLAVFFLSGGPLLRPAAAPAAVAALLLAACCYFFYRHPYFFYLLILAIPVKLSTVRRRFHPAESFAEVHARVQGALPHGGGRLQVLDISTGTCNSLYRHGWMGLDADYTGLDLSERMILQGQEFMARARVPMDFALGDAARLPFRAETFDVVLNYGAVNGFADPRRALEEMARVTKRGGLVLFLDEQLYEGASAVESLYFKKVLSSHNVIHRCPVEMVPASITGVRVSQVYHFYYICTGYKQ
jgi:SAM-dependent methyltransferase